MPIVRKMIPITKDAGVLQCPVLDTPESGVMLNASAGTAVCHPLVDAFELAQLLYDNEALGCGESF